MKTRFAPSPTGLLHLGHAFSALTAWDRAASAGGTCLLRIEDIDQPRSKPEFEAAIYEDLKWLGFDWPKPVMRQSDRMHIYREALDRLIAQGVCYPCRCSRGDIRAALSAPQEGSVIQGPDGPVYPGTCRGRPMSEAGASDAIRLNTSRALELLSAALGFDETGSTEAGHHDLEPNEFLQTIGDIVLARRDIGTSYHLAVVVDDAEQEITEVVRGSDLFSATPIHVLLQSLLGLSTPSYHHHRLIRDTAGKRLAKRNDARALSTLRAEGKTPRDIRTLAGL